MAVRMADDSWSIFFDKKDSGLSFSTLRDANEHIAKNAMRLEQDLLLVGTCIVDAKTGERIDPMTVTEVAQ